MCNNRLIIAAAGSGKTTFLVKEALKLKNRKVLFTTYTQANDSEIRKKIIEINNCIPENLTIQTWFSFLLQHGARPYQGCLFEKKINGLLLVNNQSGLKYVYKGIPVYFSEEKDFEDHYFSKSLKIYSDKLSKFVFRCNEKTNGDVIDRLSRIYSHIFIDEVQDLAGYDLELLKLLFKSKTETLLVGDPRQGTYSTNSAPKNKKFKKSAIVYFFADSSIDIERDTTSLTTNYRCVKGICDLSNKLFPDQVMTTSGNNTETGHDGVFLIRSADVNNYIETYNPVQLRDNIKTHVNDNYRVMNFGESKGLSFDRVLIYPTQPFCNWLFNIHSELAPTSRSKFYVAITRARFSVGIVYDYHSDTQIEGIMNY
ncbi:MAG: UvrD-helicase domain-containing protein [Nanoarchaeota archaeon]|nr:UvrD-helicase domain-containing protein [Nanoarchaeota archaeon]